MKIHFRKVASPLNVAPFKQWHVEYYDDDVPGGIVFPVGVAYVISKGDAFAQLNFIIVADEWRKRGIDSQLVTAIKERWDNLCWTGPMGDAGKRLLQSMGMRADDDE